MGRMRNMSSAQKQALVGVTLMALVFVGVLGSGGLFLWNKALALVVHIMFRAVLVVLPVFMVQSVFFTLKNVVFRDSARVSRWLLAVVSLAACLAFACYAVAFIVWAEVFDLGFGWILAPWLVSFLVVVVCTVVQVAYHAASTGTRTSTSASKVVS